MLTVKFDGYLNSDFVEKVSNNGDIFYSSRVGLRNSKADNRSEKTMWADIIIWSDKFYKVVGSGSSGSSRSSGEIQDSFNLSKPSQQPSKKDISEFFSKFSKGSRVKGEGKLVLSEYKGNTYYNITLYRLELVPSLPDTSSSSSYIRSSTDDGNSKPQQRKLSSQVYEEDLLEKIPF